jgi:hypothetical protein
MLTPKFTFAVLALAVVGSTSSVLADQVGPIADWTRIPAASASQTSGPAREEQRRGYDARANVQRKQDRYVAPFGLSEPFTAAEKRKFQTPTGQEVDTW